MTDANSSNPEDDVTIENPGDNSSYRGDGSDDWVVGLLVRALFMIGYSFVAYVVLWALIIMAIVQFVVVCVQREPNNDLKRFSRSMVQYLFELFAFICFATEEKPFPFGPFPSVPD